jgi:hypothetical protein
VFDFIDQIITYIEGHELLFQLVLTGIVSILSALFGYYYFTLKDFFVRRRPLSRVFCFEKNSTVYITSGDDPASGTDKPPIMQPGDVAALIELYSTLRSNRKDLNVVYYPSGTLPADALDENLISVGGPHSNSTTNLLLEKLSSSLNFDKKGRLLSPTLDKPLSFKAKGNTAVDYGFFIKSRNPFRSDESKYVYIIAGCETWGVLAAARRLSWLYAPTSIRKLAKLFKNKPIYQIVKTDMINFHVTDISVVDQGTWPIETHVNL